MYMSERHQEGLAHLLYGMNTGGGFIALTGEVGTGKTTLCHCLLQQLPDNINLAYILNPKLNAVELLSTICDELAIECEPQQDSLKYWVDKINHYLLATNATGKRTVLLIDEAQNLSLEVLEQLRLLTNLETSYTKLLQIVLVGQPELKALLARQELRQLNQRITARYHLKPLSYQETSAYIQHRLTVCDGDPEIFKPAIIKKIYRYSLGIPRLINVLCDRALLGAYVINARTISHKILDQAAQETIGIPVGYRRSIAIKAVGVAGLIIMAISYYLANPALIDHAFDVNQPDIQATPLNPVNQWLQPAPTSFNASLTELLTVWKKTVPIDKEVNCNYAATIGFNCLLGKANWEELKKLNRPAVLELNSENGQRHYVILVGFDKDQVIVQVNNREQLFPLDTIQRLWDGYYLLLWHPSRVGIIEIHPNQRSNDIVWLRKQLSEISNIPIEPLSNPQFFDELLKQKIINYQSQHDLTPDGIVGAKTLIYMQNEKSSADSVYLKIIN